jgi:NAD(P)-dependent dehydrogenase (short-subunit alcohol dehydrogenase family)
VRVNAVLPAATDTPMLRAGFAKNAEGFKALGAFHPLGRICAPEEIAAFIAFLGGAQRERPNDEHVCQPLSRASSDSSKSGFITGSHLAIDGGIGGRLYDPN